MCLTEISDACYLMLWPVDFRMIPPSHITLTRYLGRFQFGYQPQYLRICLAYLVFPTLRDKKVQSIFFIFILPLVTLIEAIRPRPVNWTLIVSRHPVLVAFSSQFIDTLPPSSPSPRRLKAQKGV